MLLNDQISSESNKQVVDIDTTPVPMELEPELNSHHGSNQTAATVSATTTPQVDLESELREFLEGDASNLATADDVGIEQMLMD